MAALRTLALLSLMVGVSTALDMDCSYFGLLDHLNVSRDNHALADVRPVKNWTTPTRVQADLVIFGILNVDEKAQTLTTQSWSTMAWKNEFLTWNPSDFCGIDKLFVQREMLWMPDIIIVEDVSDTGSVRRSLHATVSSDGVVSVGQAHRLTTTCQMELYRFPFDTQTCNITFTSVTEIGTVLEMASNGSVLTKYSESLMITQGEWSLGSIKISKVNVKANYTHQLSYQVTIERRPLLYVMNLLLPLLYFLVLDVASFFIFEARGEKLNFKVTILLSFSVLLLILQDILPSTTDTLPLIALYCIVIFTLVWISVLEAMLVNFLFDLDKAKRATCSGVHTPAETRILVPEESAGEAEKAEEKPGKYQLSLRWPSDVVLLKLILEEVKVARQEYDSTVREEQERNQPGSYEKVARIIDSVFFVTYVVVNVGFLVYMHNAWLVK
ncbi:5-hydroxytryptamine receptor 3A-like isoform X2 [Myripristis murdjan]|uniref:5-hydroxytryptamine receptor 3A-like isoform X2 n=1 Tax=Myripristis murdjan TaxID=586833 RepID=UPI0011761EFA|nr:5-hydroxytryptamine receptor 3A-like isoform X2 [Myripristis murdjan]